MGLLDIAPAQLRAQEIGREVLRREQLIEDLKVVAPHVFNVSLEKQEGGTLTLDEAIAHVTVVSNSLTGCSACAIEHKQLAAWLTELKALRNLIGKGRSTS